MRVPTRGWTQSEGDFLVGYHMVKWEALSTPNEIGGLGFFDTREMNAALLGKWIYQIESRDNSPCVQLLKKKYLGEEGSSR